MKKKILIFIALITLILNIKINVYADSEGPEIIGYQVVVKDKDGTPLYNESGKKVTTIPYKGVAYVLYEGYDDDNNKILYVQYKEYDDYYNYINASDVIPKDFKLSSANSYDEKQEAIIFNKNGGILYEGPSEIYDKLPIVIPTGTTISYKYYTSDDNWAYIEYKGSKGWININSYDTELGYVVDKHDSDRKVLSVNDKGKFYSSIYLNENEAINTIPFNTKLECIYEYNGDRCYVKYKEQYGWIKYDKNFVYRYQPDENVKQEKIIVAYNMYLYKDTTFKTKYDITIPSYTYIDDYYYQNINDEEYHYYVKYKNQYGFLNDVKRGIAYCEHSDSVSSGKNIDIYEKPDANSNIISTIQKETYYTPLCSTNYIYESCWTYVKYNDVNGWINNDDLYDDEEENTPNDDVIEKPNTDKEKEEVKWYKKLKPVQFALLCIGAAVILAGTAIVTIVLIKKTRKKQTKTETKEVNKDSEKDDNKEQEINTVVTKEQSETEEKVIEKETVENESKEQEENNKQLIKK